jgi:hypothetical protein
MRARFVYEEINRDKYNNDKIELFKELKIVIKERYVENDETKFSGNKFLYNGYPIPYKELNIKEINNFLKYNIYVNNPNKEYFFKEINEETCSWIANQFMKKYPKNKLYFSDLDYFLMYSKLVTASRQKFSMRNEMDRKNIIPELLLKKLRDDIKILDNKKYRKLKYEEIINIYKNEENRAQTYLSGKTHKGNIQSAYFSTVDLLRHEYNLKATDESISRIAEEHKIKYDQWKQNNKKYENFLREFMKKLFFDEDMVLYPENILELATEEYGINFNKIETDDFSANDLINDIIDELGLITNYGGEISISGKIKEFPKEFTDLILKKIGYYSEKELKEMSKKQLEELMDKSLEDGNYDLVKKINDALKKQ